MVIILHVYNTLHTKHLRQQTAVIYNCASAFREQFAPFLRLQTRARVCVCVFGSNVMCKNVRVCVCLWRAVVREIHGRRGLRTPYTLNPLYELHQQQHMNSAADQYRFNKSNCMAD